MYIKDLQTGKVRKYGADRHDSLVISEDGRTLSYYNLQNGDGSRYGDYRFCDEEGKIPAETECNYGEEYFNIGGWGEPRFLAHSDGSIEQINESKTGHWITKIKSDLRGDMWSTNPKCSECGGEPKFRNTIHNYKFCPYCGAKMESEVMNEDS